MDFLEGEGGTEKILIRFAHPSGSHSAVYLRFAPVRQGAGGL